MTSRGEISFFLIRATNAHAGSCQIVSIPSPLYDVRTVFSLFPPSILSTIANIFT
jgi:hypothetical protein